MTQPKYFTEFPTPLGQLTLVGTARGLTGVYLESHRHGPGLDERAAWVRDDARFAGARAQFDEYFTGRRTQFDLPLDREAAGGTDFQRRVWAALEQIPPGETISYGELARRIGRPDAVRAVGLANGRNPLCIVVPCHRVIGANGQLVGFGGGLPRKRALLDLEAAARPRDPTSPVLLCSPVGTTDVSPAL